jgi:hypothetical protein
VAGRPASGIVYHLAGAIRAAPVTSDDRAYGAQLGDVLRQRSVPALRAFLEAQASRYGDERQVDAIRAQSDVAIEALLHRMTLARADLTDLHPESERWLAAQAGPGAQRPTGAPERGQRPAGRPRRHRSAGS